MMSKFFLHGMSQIQLTKVAQIQLTKVAHFRVALTMETELAVLIAVRVGLPVFQPQKAQRDPLAGQLPAKILHGRQSPFLGQRGR